MAFLPKSRTARKRLMIVGVAGVVLVVAAGLAIVGLGQSVDFFYTPTQAASAHVQPGRHIQLGGMVQPGSLKKAADGMVSFVVTDCGRAQALVAYDPAAHGDLPDLFREGQGVVTKGAFQSGGGFVASEVLAKHDERYMPRELTKSLKESGKWNGNGEKPTAGQAMPSGDEEMAAYMAACASTKGAQHS